MSTPDHARTIASLLSATESDTEAHANRTLLKSVRLTHSLSIEERELALVLTQAIVAWGGLSESRRAEG